MYHCKGYCGLSCVDGSCPQIEDKSYDCSECWLYKGCDDCCYVDSEYCTNYDTQNFS